MPIMAAALALAIGTTSAVAAPDICWSSGVTPGGHYYRVRYVPARAITVAAGGQMHTYEAVAVALLPGWIWASREVPCTAIPWAHEERHLDGWVHDDEGDWIGQHPVPADPAPGPWYVVKRGNARLPGGIAPAACKNREVLPGDGGPSPFLLLRDCPTRHPIRERLASAAVRKPTR